MKRGDKPAAVTGWRDLREIRRDNVRRLARQMGSDVAFAERLAKTKSQVSGMLARKPSPNNRYIGHVLAREIERAFDLPSGWLDLEHDEAPKGTTPRTAEPPAPSYRVGLLAQRAEEVESLVAQLLERMRELMDNIKRLKD